MKDDRKEITGEIYNISITYVKKRKQDDNSLTWTDFLDVSLDLRTNCYMTLHMPNENLKCINKYSCHSFIVFKKN